MEALTSQHLIESAPSLPKLPPKPDGITWERYFEMLDSATAAGALDDTSEMDQSALNESLRL
jgi:hypothetical protein